MSRNRTFVTRFVALCAAMCCVAWAASASAEPCKWTLERLSELNGVLKSQNSCDEKYDQVTKAMTGIMPAAEACANDAKDCAGSDCEKQLKTARAAVADAKSTLTELSVWIAANCNPYAAMPSAACQATCEGSGGTWSGSCSCPAGKALRGSCLCAPRRTGGSKTVTPKPPPPPKCIADHDKDGVTDCDDNCLVVENKDQADEDKDGVGDACEVMQSTEIQARFLFIESYTNELKGKGIGAKEFGELMAWLKKNKDALVLKPFFVAAQTSIRSGFDCLAEHKLPTFEFNKTDGVLVFGGCVEDPYWTDFLAERKCIADHATSEVPYYYVPTLKDGVPTGAGDCREDARFRGWLDRLEGIDKRFEDLESRVAGMEHSFVYPFVGFTGQYYFGMDRYALTPEAGVRFPHLFGSDHLSLEPLFRMGAGSNESGAWGGAIRLHVTPGSPEDTVRFDIGIGPSVMNFTDLSSANRLTNAGALGIEVQPALNVRISSRCGLRVGIPVSGNRYWGAREDYGVGVGGTLDFLCSYKY